nr:GntR family transcriptional regulator [Streptomyces hawaiiensis]
MYWYIIFDVATQYGFSGTTAKGIAASVERSVAEGTLEPGSALPPVRRLADELGVSPGTVAAAYQELRRRGIVVTRGRGGTVVAPAPAVASRRPPRAPEGLRNLADGHPDHRLLPGRLPSSRLSPRPGRTARRPGRKAWRKPCASGSAPTVCRWTM